MNSDSPNLLETLETNTDGSILFNGRRALLLDAEFLKRLKQRVFDTHELKEGSRIVWNASYACGFQDALSLKKKLRKKDKKSGFQSGILQLANRGIAQVKILEFQEDEILIQTEWSNSWEVEGIVEETTRSCSTVSGYLSGLASAIFDKSVLFIEESCKVRGDAVCLATGKVDWKDDDEIVISVSKMIEEATHESFDFQTEIAKYEPALDRIRQLVTELEAHKTEIETFQMQVHHLQESSFEENPFQEMIGTSSGYQKALQNAKKVAESDSTVLIQGETGTGKELFARYIYKNSLLNNRPFITVNCAALPVSLVESELFGHEKGAFTGAMQKKLGRFEIANYGTIFLDEIGELPLETQAKFLRVLQEGEFERLGSSQTVKVKVRVLAATNRDLAELVEEGKFRADLYYRLNVFPVLIPPLRERNNDIVQLVDYFAQSFRKRFQKPIKSVNQTSIENLKNYHFPGNVRELKHLVERAVLLSEGETLNIDLPFSPDTTEVFPFGNSDKMLTLEEMERKYIETVLQQTNGMIAGKKGAAEILDLPASTLRSKMKKLGISK